MKARTLLNSLAARALLPLSRYKNNNFTLSSTVQKTFAIKKIETEKVKEKKKEKGTTTIVNLTIFEVKTTLTNVRNKLLNDIGLAFLNQLSTITHIISNDLQHKYNVLRDKKNRDLPDLKLRYLRPCQSREFKITPKHF